MITPGCICTHIVTVAGDVTTIGSRIRHPGCPIAELAHGPIPLSSFAAFTAPMFGPVNLQVVDPDPAAIPLFGTALAASFDHFARQAPSPTMVDQVPAGAHVGERYTLPNGATVQVTARSTT